MPEDFLYGFPTNIWGCDVEYGLFDLPAAHASGAEVERQWGAMVIGWYDHNKKSFKLFVPDVKRLDDDQSRVSKAIEEAEQIVKYLTLILRSGRWSAEQNIKGQDSFVLGEKKKKPFYHASPASFDEDEYEWWQVSQGKALSIYNYTVRHTGH